MTDQKLDKRALPAIPGLTTPSSSSGDQDSSALIPNFSSLSPIDQSIALYDFLKEQQQNPPHPSSSTLPTANCITSSIPSTSVPLHAAGSATTTTTITPRTSATSAVAAINTECQRRGLLITFTFHGAAGSEPPHGWTEGPWGSELRIINHAGQEILREQETVRWAQKRDAKEAVAGKALASAKALPLPGKSGKNGAAPPPGDVDTEKQAQTDDEWENWVGILIEHSQVHRPPLPAPTFALSTIQVPSSNPVFTCAITLPLHSFPSSSTPLPSKRLAKARAARLAVEYLRARDALCTPGSKRRRTLTKALLPVATTMANPSTPVAVERREGQDRSNDSESADFDDVDFYDADETPKKEAGPPAAAPAPTHVSPRSPAADTAADPSAMAVRLCTALGLPQLAFRVNPAPAGKDLFAAAAVLPRAAVGALGVLGGRKRGRSVAGEMDGVKMGEDEEGEAVVVVASVSGVVGRKRARAECAARAAGVLEGWRRGREEVALREMGL